MSWLHVVSDPFVTVWVNPVCEKEECEEKLRGEISDMMRIIMGEDGASALENDVQREVTGVGCRVCGKTEKTRKCARCKVVTYCGREHQREDWRVHKNVCGLLAERQE